MPDEPEAPPADVHEGLYALFVYLNVSANRDLIDAIAREQLSFSQLLLLDRLRGGRRRPTMKQAADMMRVSPTGASRIVDSLARRELVTRETADTDFRVKRIQITEKGEQTIARLHAARLDRLAEFTDKLNATERTKLTAAVNELLERDAIAACRPVPLPA